MVHDKLSCSVLRLAHFKDPIPLQTMPQIFRTHQTHTSKFLVIVSPFKQSFSYLSVDDEEMEDEPTEDYEVEDDKPEEDDDDDDDEEEEDDDDDEEEEEEEGDDEEENEKEENEEDDDEFNEEEFEEDDDAPTVETSPDRLSSIDSYGSSYSPM